MLIRHAIAAERQLWPGAEKERPLTDEGRERFRLGARALAKLVPELERVATSPLRRCIETAEILAASWSPALPLDIEAGLAPDGGALKIVRRRIADDSSGTLALVGHEPDLSRLLAQLLIGGERAFTQFKKGGAALVELTGDPAGGARHGSGLLVWHLTASQLRRLA